MAVNIGAELQALPLEYMLGAPLAAAVRGQALAAQTTVDFIEKVGLVEDDEGNLVVRNVQFEYSKQVTDAEDPAAEAAIERHELTVPMLSIVPIPYVRVDNLNVDFEFKVRETVTRTSKREITTEGGTKSVVETTAKMGGGFLSFLGGPSVSVKANVTSTFNVSASYKSTSRQTEDRSARIAITMKAVQDTMPEGLSRVLNILSDAITSEQKTA